MDNIDPGKRLAGDLNDLVQKEWGHALTTSTNHSETLTAESLLAAVERLPPPLGAMPPNPYAPMSMGGIPIVVSEFVPTVVVDELRADERPMLRRFFTRNLCGVQVEEVEHDQILLMNFPDGGQQLVASPAAAAVLRVTL